MSLEQKVMEEMKTAMKAKDEAGLRTLRAIKAAILIEKTAEGGGNELNEASELKMLQKMAKQRRDSLDIFVQQNREDLAAKEREELAILERFLPKQMSAEELQTEVKAIIAQVGASSPADMGKVMGVASKQLAGKADGKAISETVKSLLSQGA
ncbi:MAG TPA: GatB/YqeY domain-containing protein [Chitinophagaceae bacterium]|nr:GatB/YqeY domain-containing protein [Chitinophagaceae bacterium]